MVVPCLPKIFSVIMKGMGKIMSIHARTVKQAYRIKIVACGLTTQNPRYERALVKNNGLKRAYMLLF